MTEEFTHLHVATSFSAPYGVSSPEDLAAAAEANGASALACTDRDGLYGAVKHVSACKQAGLDPIVGVDLAILAEPDDDGGAHPGAKKPRRGSSGVAGRVVVLAHGHNAGAGWKALCRLVSDAHAHTGGKAGSAVQVGVLRSELAARCIDPDTGRPVLTVLIGPDSDVGRAMSGPRFLRPRTLFRDWLDAMPVGVVTVELVTHLTAPGQPLSTSHAVRMLRLANEHSVPAILTNGVRYAEENGASGEPSGQSWLKPAALMHQLGREIIGSAGLGGHDLANLLGNTERIADRCRLDPALDAGWGQPIVPEASVVGFAGEPQQELAERCRAGIARRFPGFSGDAEERVQQRLDHELQIVGNLGFASYFLAVGEVVEAIRGMGVRSAVPGPGASSLVNYLLSISHIDPVRHGLVFEHFLARDGSSFPDLEIDVESAEQRNIYRRIFKRFGSQRAALVSMQNGYRAPGGAQRRGLPLGLDEGEAGDIAKRLDGLPLDVSTPPWGVILGDAGLLDRTPVQPSGVGLPMSQFEKDDIGRIGVIKLGLVGARLQSSMAFAAREAERIKGIAIDLDAVPLDDEPTYELIRSTRTLGCFEIESPARRELAGRVGPRAFSDLITDGGLAQAMPTYQAAWLKAHHPEAFLAGVFEHEPGMCPKRVLVAEARRMDVPILPLDINASRDEYRVERVEEGPDARRLGIRLALKGITGVSEAELRRIVDGQPYATIADLRDRARLSRSSLRRLAELGALDSLHRDVAARGSRADLLAHLAQLASRPASRRDEPIEGQLALDIA